MQPGNAPLGKALASYWLSEATHEKYGTKDRAKNQSIPVLAIVSSRTVKVCDARVLWKPASSSMSMMSTAENKTV